MVVLIHVAVLVEVQHAEACRFVDRAVFVGERAGLAPAPVLVDEVDVRLVDDPVGVDVGRAVARVRARAKPVCPAARPLCATSARA